MSFNIAKFLFGWLTPKHDEPDYDEFPRGFEAMCMSAKISATHWYQAKYKAVPKVPFVRVTIERDYRDRMGAWTNNAHDIRIWKDQYPFYGSLEHEFRHAICLYNCKGGSEGVVK